MEKRVNLREVTLDNVREIIILSDTLSESQKNCVAPNAVSVAQGSLHGSAWYRAIYLDQTPIGFVMVDLNQTEHVPPENRPAVFLWRFMIARNWQGTGYARLVLDQLVDSLRDQGVCSMYTSCVMDQQESPYQFYIKYGFIDTGIEEEDERLLYFKFPQPENVHSETGYNYSSRVSDYMIPKIALITIWTEHIEKMKEFYHRVLGFFIKTDLGSYVEFENQGARFAICEREVMHESSSAFSEESRGQSFELAFPCEKPEDVDMAYEILVQKGAGAVAPPQNMPWNQRTALFSDPDGNIHEIFAELEDQ